MLLRANTEIVFEVAREMRRVCISELVGDIAEIFLPDQSALVRFIETHHPEVILGGYAEVLPETALQLPLPNIYLPAQV